MARKLKTDTVTAYKAFDPDFSCRGHKFEVGQTYTVMPVSDIPAERHECGA